MSVLSILLFLFNTPSALGLKPEQTYQAVTSLSGIIYIHISHKQPLKFY